jgi:hypothetical protein
MIKFLTLFFISTAAFAAPHLILEKHAVSGYVMPEDSFVKECRIYREGYLETYTKKGDGTSVGASMQVNAVQIAGIRTLVRLSSNGSIKISPMPCDIGTVIVKGHRLNQVIELESSIDCGEKRLNNSYAASVLRSMAESLCGF